MAIGRLIIRVLFFFSDLGLNYANIRVDNKFMQLLGGE